jgi:Ion channel
LRRVFFSELWNGLKLVWPIVSGLLGIMVLLGLVIAWREGWHLTDGLYFAFVSGLTIGYGDLVPKHPMSRTLAIAIGFTGILLTGLVAAIAVRALERATK